MKSIKIKSKECRSEGCSNMFQPFSSVQKYCSHSCSYENKKKNDSYNRSLKSKKPESKKCSFCSEQFKPYNSLQKFCSFKCSNDNEKNNRSTNWTEQSCNSIKGKNNPNFKTGLYIRNKNKNRTGDREFEKSKKILKKNLINKKGFLYCEVCGTTNSLKFETHHLIFRSEKPLHKHLHSIENLLYCCIQCHNNFHKIKGVRNNIVKNRKLNLLFGSDVLNK